MKSDAKKGQWLRMHLLEEQNNQSIYLSVGKKSCGGEIGYNWCVLYGQSGTGTIASLNAGIFLA